MGIEQDCIKGTLLFKLYAEDGWLPANFGQCCVQTVQMSPNKEIISLSFYITNGKNKRMKFNQLSH